MERLSAAIALLDSDNATSMLGQIFTTRTFRLQREQLAIYDRVILAESGRHCRCHTPDRQKRLGRRPEKRQIGRVADSFTFNPGDRRVMQQYL